MNIRIEKIDTYEGVAVKELLNSGAMGMFMDQRTAVKHGFRLQKLKRFIMVKNMDGTNNSGCEGDRSGLQEIPQLNYNMEYVTTHLQEIPQRIR